MTWKQCDQLGVIGLVFGLKGPNYRDRASGKTGTVIASTDPRGNYRSHPFSEGM